MKVNTPIAVLLQEGERPARPPSRAQGCRRRRKPQNRPGAGGCRRQSPREAKAEPARQRRTLRSGRPQGGIAADPDIPAGTEMVKTTVREALRDAMAEEMRRDPDVFVMGEEVAEYQGAYKITPGPAAKSSVHAASSIRPLPSMALPASVSAPPWPACSPIVEFMTFNFAMQAIDQIINSAAKTLYMSGGQMGAPIVFRGPNGAAARVGRPAQPVTTSACAWPYARPEGGDALHILLITEPGTQSMNALPPIAPARGCPCGSCSTPRRTAARGTRWLPVLAHDAAGGTGAAQRGDPLQRHAALLGGRGLGLHRWSGSPSSAPRP